jgi:hypothetical protein
MRKYLKINNGSAEYNGMKNVSKAENGTKKSYGVLVGIETEYLKLVSYMCGCYGFKKAHGFVTKICNGREVGIDGQSITDIATGTEVKPDYLYEYITTVDFTEIDSNFAKIKPKALKNIDIKPGCRCIHDDNWSMREICM